MNKQNSNLKKIKHIITDNFLSYMIAAFLIVYIGQMLGAITCMLPMGIEVKNDGDEIELGFKIMSSFFMTAILYLADFGIWILCLVWFFRKNNRYLFAKITSRQSGNRITMLLLGIVIGAVANGVCIFAASLHGDIHVEYDTFKPLHLFILFVCVFIQSSAEELVCRIYLYNKLLNRYNASVAIILSSLFFAFLHIGNDNVNIIALIDLFFFGLVAALTVYYFNGIWCAFTIHTAWNYTQNIVFGLPNSGMESGFSIFTLDTEAASDSFFYNAGFGVEGTVFAVIVEIMTCLLIVGWGRNRERKRMVLLESNQGENNG